MEKKFRVAVIGCGNVGTKAVDAVKLAPDMELAGIVEVPAKIEALKAKFPGVEVVDHVSKLKDVDAAAIAVDSTVASSMAIECMKLGINTSDPYDTYSEPFLEYKKKLDVVAKETGRVAVLCAGWDPGFDAMARIAMEAMIPFGITYTNFGPGQSMSHSAAAKTVDGVADAYSLTLPKGCGQHKRMIHVKLEEGADPEEVAKKVLALPHFSHDECHVVVVDDIPSIADSGHTLNVETKGMSAGVHNHRASFTMSNVNPAATAQSMVTAIRATFKQAPGAYTVIEIPPIDFIHGDRDYHITRLIYPDALLHS